MEEQKRAAAEKLWETFSQYNQGNLAEKKYVIIRNLHTRYLVKSEKETVKIQVSEGEVQAALGSEKINVSKGEKIQISGENEVSRGRVFPSWAYPVGGGLIAAGLTFVLIKYRKSKAVKDV